MTIPILTERCRLTVSLFALDSAVTASPTLGVIDLPGRRDIQFEGFAEMTTMAASCRRLLER